MAMDGMELPTKDDLNDAHLNAVKKYKNFKYDSQQIAIMREKKNRHRNARSLANPHKEKLRVSTLIGSMGEYDPKRQELANYLSEINREIERRSSASSQSVKVSIASINEKNKIKNKKLMLKAREKERKLQLSRRGQRQQKDPFTRSLTAPQIESFNSAPGDLDEDSKKEDKKEDKHSPGGRARAEQMALETLALLDVARTGPRRQSGGLDDGLDAEGYAGSAYPGTATEGNLIPFDEQWTSAVHDIAKEFVADCVGLDIVESGWTKQPQFGRNTYPSKYAQEYTKRPEGLKIISIDEYMEKYKYN